MRSSRSPQRASVSADALAEQLANALQGEAVDLACAYLFGSVASGQECPGSDVDLAVLFRELPPRTLAGLHLDLADRLTGALGGRRVELERDRSSRIRFEVRARNASFDVLPHLQRYRRGRDGASR